MENEIKVEEHLKLVHYTLNKYHKGVLATINNRNISYDDLFQMGCLGLLLAKNRWNSELSSFPTYAVATINNEIKKYFRDHNTPIKFSRLAKSAALQMKGEVDVTIETIMEKTNCTKYVAEQAVAYMKNYTIGSLDKKIKDSDDSDTLGEVIPDSNKIDLEFNIMYKEFIETLNERRKAILQMKIDGYSQTYIGKALNISQPHVSREVKAIKSSLKAFKGGELCLQ